FQAVGTPRASAQDFGSGGSLGGYGGSMSSSPSGMGMSGPVIPYAGKFGGFMPARMGGGSLSFPSRDTSAMGTSRTSFSLSSMSGGMSSMSGGMGGGARSLSSFGSRGGMGLDGGMGLGSGMVRPMAGAKGMGVMPPSFGYPFYQPPSLLSPSSAGMGMSM
ncbi:MAG TPA: hypothetical protein VGZ22_17475, partial [Isosphaeraceae bacterium]|nr:hypothetical protein [Isosphaeraceae bacterium]